MWLPVVGYENLYEIDQHCVIRRVASKRVIPPKCGKVVLSRKGVPKNVSVAEIVSSSITQEAMEAAAKAPIYSDVESACMDYPWSYKEKSAILTGDIGEHLVCIELLSRGVRAGLNIMQGAPYDVIGDFGRGHLFKVQVKTRVYHMLHGLEKYSFHAKDNEPLSSCDVMAYVSANTRGVMFELCSESNSASKRISRDEFDAQAGVSIDEVLHKLYLRQSTPSKV